MLPVPYKLSLKAAASPLGQRRPLPTVVDDSVLTWKRVLCSAGKRGLQVVLAPTDLVRLTKAVTADILATRQS